MVHKLHKGTSEQVADPAVWEDPVITGHERHDEDQTQTDDDLRKRIPLSPAGQSLVPNARK